MKEKTMNETPVYHIDLADFFTEVNRRRAASGLPPVEPAVMAIRANIRLAIQRHRPIDPKQGEADLDAAEAEALCQTVRDLFGAAPELTPFALPASPPQPDAPNAADNQEKQAPAEASGPCYLPLVKFYEQINRQRREHNQPLIEPAVIAVRTSLRFTLLRRRQLDFGGTHLQLDADDITALERILREQFNTRIPNGLASLCEQAPAQAKKAAATLRERAGRWFSRLLGRRRVSIDPLNLILAISQQRARMGYRPLSPSEIKRRCQDRIALELEFKGNLDEENIKLSQEELDRLAEIIREEFQVIFDNLEEFLEESKR